MAADPSCDVHSCQHRVGMQEYAIVCEGLW
jgi:hypothetical protein